MSTVVNLTSIRRKAVSVILEQSSTTYSSVILSVNNYWLSGPSLNSSIDAQEVHAEVIAIQLPTGQQVSSQLLFKVN